MLGRYKGQCVLVVVDRPKGSRHPAFPDIVYPINYGYLSGTMSEDGEPIDAYVLGLDAPVTAARGIVVGIVVRRDDVEDKLVVSTTGEVYTKAEIRAAVAFQEQFFDSDVDIDMDR
jgi:inorganic pyrophosphatase